VLVGADAVNVGLINEIGGLSKAVAKVKELADQQSKNAENAKYGSH
jgi:ClpP class serine protease